MEGYIALHRKITENEFYFSEKFTKSQAWIDLLLLATHNSRTFYIRNIEVKLNPGEFCYSQKSLAARWKWNYKTVCKFLDMLKKREMVVTKTNNLTTIIFIKNWHFYQFSRDATVNESSYYGEQNGDQNGEQKVTKTVTNNNEYNVNNVNNVISDPKNNLKIPNIKTDYKNTVTDDIFKIIPPKIEWIIERCSIEKYPEIENESEKFFNYYESNGWKVGNSPMKNWSSALCNWFKNYETFNKSKNIENGKYKFIKESKSERINRNIEAAGRFLSNINSNRRR